MLQHKKCIVFCFLRKSNSSLFNILNIDLEVDQIFSMTNSSIVMRRERSDLRLAKADCVNLWTNKEKTEIACRLMVSDRSSSWLI